MAGTSNKITLTIAGDSSGVEKALARTEAAGAKAGAAVAQSSKHAGDGLHQLRNNANGAAAGVDGFMYATRALGGEVSATTQSVYGLSLGASQLAHGARSLIPAVKDWAGSLTLVRGAGLAAGTALAALALQMESKSTGSANIFKKGLADLNYAVATNIDLVGRHIPFLNELTGAYLSNADGASQAAHATASLTEQLIRLDNQKRAAGTYGIADQNPGGDAFVDQAALDMLDLSTTPVKTATAHIARAYSSGGSSIAKAIDTAAQKQKDRLAKWQGIADSFSNIAKGIADSLGPKLVAGIASPLMLAKGTSLLDNLRKQLADTKHLQDDLARLSKVGLSRGLLEQLTAGGLDSLGTADELLASGKSGIKSVNKVAGQINAAAGSIAGADAARQFADSLKKPQVVELRVGKGGDDVLDRWLQKALKTKGPKFYGLKAA